MTDGLRRRFEQVYAVHHAAILGYTLRRTAVGERLRSESTRPGGG